jgi:HlyD family secretion protein
MDEVIKRSKFSKRMLVIFFSVIAFVVSYKLATIDEKVRSINVDASSLSFAMVESDTFEDNIPVYGHIYPLRTVFLDTTRGGIVEEIYAEEGGFIREGEPILKFKNLEFKLQAFSQEARVLEQLDINSNTRLSLDQNRLDIQRKLNDIEFDLKVSKRELASLGRLKELGHIAEKVYLEAKDRHEYLLKAKEINLQAQEQDEALREIKIAQLAESAARLNEHMLAIQQSLDQLVLIAPVAGKITSLPVEIGESKNVSDRIGQIDVLAGYKVIALLDSFYLSRVKVDQLASFFYSDSELMLRVEKVYPEIKEGKFQVDLLFEDTPPKDIVRGQNVNLSLKLGQPQESLLVEKGGFIQDVGGSWVFVVSEDGLLALRREVQFGRKNSQYIEVLSGIEKGERIISSSYANFKDMHRLVIRY